MTTLRSLDVSGSDLTEDSFHVILRRAPNLRVLNSAAMKQVTARFVQNIEGLLPNIEEWNLSGCKIVNDSFLKALTGSPKLRVLNLSFCSTVRLLRVPTLAS